ncbi:2-methoxy-6-polyprenyl-1,4-benzoquinol methylase, mitochondrial-like isoform X2 [Corticium candelabrum]|nr:2-methoxy-6-polyprenyl-1,4-benzoquinol methylase, mitochondrial-like isoform X2 [Corticium candelabrum]
MNDVMSAGVHRLWKDEFVRRLAPTSDATFLDVAGGTGDIAFRILQYQKLEQEKNRSRSDSVKPRITVCDINHEMLAEGARISIDRGYSSGISWICGDAEKLPVCDNSVDAYTIAFGIRNVTHLDKALQEAFRVLTDGGRFMCLEFSHMTNAMLERLYDVYSFEVIPIFGEIFARDRQSYEYLVESIRMFPAQEEFADMIRNAGFSCIRYENFSSGIVAIHSGFKLQAPLA